MELRKDIRTAASYNPGDIVRMSGIDFVVLEDFGPIILPDVTGTAHNLFILALKSQGNICFGSCNNYAESELRVRVDAWLGELLKKGIDFDLIRYRTLDLTTMDGHGKYGELAIKAAPLTMDEARKYADVIPNCEDACWLSTGWGGPGFYGATSALGVNTGGGWGRSNCSIECGVRPALVISSALLASADKGPDLSDIPTEDLLAEVRRRIESGDTAIK